MLGMLQTSARLLRLLTMLQARRSWTGRDLIERLEITDRTLRRDVDRLRSLGYPVHSTSGTAGGYSLGAGVSLPPLMLDDEEGVAVAVALQTAAGGSIAGIEDAAQRALAKLEQVFPTRLRRRLKALRSSIVRLGGGGPKVDMSAVTSLAAACADQLEIMFSYQDKTGAGSQRTVEPHRLVHSDRRWYLVAWDTQRRDWRTFRVDRIVIPFASGKPFTPRSSPDDDVAAYVTRSLSSASYPCRAQVLLHAPLKTVRAQIPPGAGTLEAIDAAHCRFQTASHSYESMAVWLGLLGVDFEVEDPAELRVQLRRVAERFERAAGPSEK
jgi:predicted DNA-binding transcriptional regulator YafY